MPEYLKWAHTAVLKATVIRSEATLLYDPAIGGLLKNKSWATVWIDRIHFGTIYGFLWSF